MPRVYKITAKHGSTSMYNYHGCRCALCKNNRNALTRKYYANSTPSRKTQIIAGSRQRRIDQIIKNRALVDKLKSKPCTDCGKCYPPCIMQFDHIQDKEFSIAPNLRLGTARILREIAKCDLVCGNCHAARTFGSGRELKSLKPYAMRGRAPYHRARTAKIRKVINELKAAPCMDCGECYPPYVMHFDHRPGEIVRFDVTRGIAFSIPTTLKEITKCDLVCCNCHTVRTILIRQQHKTSAYHQQFMPPSQFP